jgi:SAM-dependent methyltransferase
MAGILMPIKKKKVDVSKQMGILLDLGCGPNKQKGFVGLDKRKMDGVDIVHDLEKFPYPLEDECAIQVLCSHIIEHIKPWLFIPFMDEIWRLCKPNAQLLISMPYGASRGFQQDPTHCNMANEATWLYFDPRHSIYNLYKPKPWKIERNVWNPQGNMEVVLAKAPLPEEGKKKRSTK